MKTKLYPKYLKSDCHEYISKCVKVPELKYFSSKYFDFSMNLQQIHMVHAIMSY